MRVLAVNAGSSSVKLALVGPADELLASCELDAPDGTLDEAALADALAGPLRDADAIGCRIVHGGERFAAPVAIDAGVESALAELADLAPLHQPRSLAALAAVRARRPEIPAVACFDTSFHAGMPAAAATYALPAAWRRRWRIRRYGFHGLSHGWVARRAAELLPADAPLRLVSCHLGAGASLCAIAGERSVDTTMGFTPLEGLVMATRSGTVDPGLLLWLLERGRVDEAELAHGLEHGSGLTGLAGTPDMRAVLERAAGGDRDAALARDVYVHRLRAAIAAMAAALGGLDAIAFTGGVGEHAPEIRSRAVAGLAFLGVAVDEERNRARREEDAEITAAGSRVRTIVVTAREDLEIARQTRGVLGD